MKVKFTHDGAVLSEVENTVWTESFGLNDVVIIANDLEQQAKHFEKANLPRSAARLTRVANIFYALANDSDACIITVEEDQ